MSHLIQVNGTEEKGRKWWMEQGREGRLYIFFGYATGVGKTYRMLLAARKAMEEGTDLLIGQLGDVACLELAKQLQGIPRLSATCRNLDLDGALLRKPGLLIVDELAHQNQEGARHKKRYQDVQELLKAGIDVYTTLSVRHIESLGDIVSAITQRTDEERVPDHIFDLAYRVELVDVEPEELLERLKQGKLFSEHRHATYFHHYTPERLTALRELALRRAADRLGRQIIREGRDQSMGEHILICLSPSPSNGKVIRAAARMAEAFHGNLTALYVETSRHSQMREEEKNRLSQHIRLARELGAHVVSVYGEDVPAQIAAYAKAGNMTKVVIGKTNTRRFSLFPRKNLIDQLTQQADNLDVYVIPYAQQAGYFGDKSKQKPVIRFSFLDLLKSLIMVLLSSLVGLFFYDAGLSDANIITVYILGVLLTSLITGGRIYGAVTSLVSVVVFNFLFTEPRFTLMAYDAGYPVTFLVMFLASFVTSTLTIRVKSQAGQAARKAYRTEALLETSQKLQKAQTGEQIMEEAAGQMIKLLNCTVLLYPAELENLLSPRLYACAKDLDPQVYLTEEERQVALWVQKNNRYAGATTDTFPGAQCLYFAVRGQKHVFAVAAIAIREVGGIDSFERDLLVAILGETGLALEKCLLDNARQQAQLKARQEQLRANLLRAISHDLRTPLTSISGNAGVLLSSGEILSVDRKMTLYQHIYDDSIWLINLVENLLSVTRIENGTLNLQMVPQLMDEVFQEALRHLHRRADSHKLSICLPDELLLARMDARLIVQVLVNLVDNGIKYTPKGSLICLTAKRQADMILVEVSDDGPGISPGTREHLFEMFFTGANHRGDGRRGMGLGLALCKAIVTEHGGTIGMRDQIPHGCVFYFTLQAAEVTIIE